MNYRQAIKKIREETGDTDSIHVERKLWDWGNGSFELSYVVWRSSILMNFEESTLEEAVSAAINYTASINKEHKEDAKDD